MAEKSASASKTTKDQSDKKQITSFFQSKDKPGPESDKSPVNGKNKGSNVAGESSCKKQSSSGRKTTPRKLIKNSKSTTKESKEINSTNGTLNPEEKSKSRDNSPAPHQNSKSNSSKKKRSKKQGDTVKDNVPAQESNSAAVAESDYKENKDESMAVPEDQQEQQD